METIKQLDPLRVRVGRSIASLRKSRGITQRQLASAANVGQDKISRLEKGTYNIQIDMLERIAAALDLDILGVTFDLKE